MDSKTCIKTECSKHSKQLKYYCFDCNTSLCSRCSIEHLKKYLCRNCQHIDDIKVSLDSTLNNQSNNNNNNNNNNNSSDNENILKNRIEEIWSNLKQSSINYSANKLKEDEIAQQFKKLYEYLMAEEYRLKAPITKDLDTIENGINKNIDELKSIVNLINVNNEISNHDNNNSKETSEENINNINDSSTSEIVDTTNKYTIESILSSIKNNETINQFIDDNTSTLFYYNDISNNDVTSSIKDLVNNNIDLMLLELIRIHYKQFTSLIVNNEHNQLNHINNNNNNNNNNSVKESFLSMITEKGSENIFDKVSLERTKIQKEIKDIEMKMKVNNITPENMNNTTVSKLGNYKSNPFSYSYEAPTTTFNSSPFIPINTYSPFSTAPATFPFFTQKPTEQIVDANSLNMTTNIQRKSIMSSSSLNNQKK